VRAPCGADPPPNATPWAAPVVVLWNRAGNGHRGVGGLAVQPLMAPWVRPATMRPAERPSSSSSNGNAAPAPWPQRKAPGNREHRGTGDAGQAGARVSSLRSAQQVKGDRELIPAEAETRARRAPPPPGEAGAPGSSADAARGQALQQCALFELAGQFRKAASSSSTARGSESPRMKGKTERRSFSTHWRASCSQRKNSRAPRERAAPTSRAHIHQLPCKARRAACQASRPQGMASSQGQQRLFPPPPGCLLKQVSARRRNHC